MAQSISVRVSINAPIDKVWEAYNNPVHVVKWNSASPDWHSPKAENDLRPGGKFNYRMEARDGSEGFDFEGTYDEVIENQLVSYTMGDNRKASVKMREDEGITNVEVTFELENENTPELQREGWQAILDSFKYYVESLN